MNRNYSAEEVLAYAAVEVRKIIDKHTTYHPYPHELSVIMIECLALSSHVRESYAYVENCADGGYPVIGVLRGINTLMKFHTEEYIYELGSCSCLPVDSPCKTHTTCPIKRKTVCSALYAERFLLTDKDVSDCVKVKTNKLPTGIMWNLWTQVLRCNGNGYAALCLMCPRVLRFITHLPEVNNLLVSFAKDYDSKPRGKIRNVFGQNLEDKFLDIITKMLNDGMTIKRLKLLENITTPYRPEVR